MPMIRQGPQMRRRVRRHARLPDFFAADLASVETYLLADRVLKALGPAFPWHPVAWRSSGRGGIPPLDGDRGAAERRAAELGVPLCWPTRHPDPLPGAMQAAAEAERQGAAAPFMQFCSRLAFAGGFDIESTDAIQSAATRIAALDAGQLVAASRRTSIAADERTGTPNGRVERVPALWLRGELAYGEAAIGRLLVSSEPGRSRSAPASISRHSSGPWTKLLRARGESGPL